jgi:hypothetical protein
MTCPQHEDCPADCPSRRAPEEIVVDPTKPPSNVARVMGYDTGLIYGGTAYSKDGGFEPEKRVRRV